jgi:subtilisin family serine protease
LLNGVQQTRRLFRQSDAAGPLPVATPTVEAYVVQVRDSSALSSVRARLRNQANIEYVHPNLTYSVDRASAPAFDPPLSPSNAYADSLDHLAVIRALTGWDSTTGNASVRVGVVDTGIYFGHPDLADQIWRNPAESQNGEDDDGNGFVDDVHGYDFVDRPGVVAPGEYTTRDADPSPDSLGAFSGHGTAVAGVIAAQAADSTAGMVGVAPEARIVPLRAFAGDGRGQTDDIAAAIVYGAQLGIDVLNLSFGRDRSAPLLRDAIEFAVSQGTVVVASAGNAGAVDTPHYPSDYPSVISVLWLAEDGDGPPDFSRSQYGIGVDLGAPGSNVFTTQYPRTPLVNEEPITPDDLYGPSNGSSFAAPQAAGAAALLRAVDSTLSPASIQNILAGTAVDVADAGWDHVTGAGRLDVARGLLQSYPAETALHAPAHNDGVTGTAPVPVVGTALDPAFSSYTVSYATGTQDLDERPDPWTTIAGPVPTRARNDTLAFWDASGLPEGPYTLRLSVERTDGRTVEDRRRVVVDGSPPAVEARIVGAGRVDGHWGVVADVASDDTVQARMEVTLDGRTAVRTGEYATPRQGLFWADDTGRGGSATVQITLTNRSGLESTLQRTVAVPPDRTTASLFSVTETDIPGGTLLPRAPDFDSDGLPEVVLNTFSSRIGGISDTVRSFEWAGTRFAPADTLLARLLPKDVGNTDEDARSEFLLQINGATILLEQSPSGGLPQSLIYADTAAVTPSQEGASLHGARLVDLDGDGRDEIVGNWRSDSTRTEWRVIERTGDSFSLRQRLPNPTSRQRPALLRSAPNAAAADFDGDGQMDLLVGDRDGNWVVYEATPSGMLNPAWTHETDRFAADRRFAVGDLMGDDRPEFVTHATYSPSPPDGAAEPPISYYYVWSAAGDDDYTRRYRLPVVGDRALGAMTMADIDVDGQDELSIVHPPSVLVVDQASSGELQVRYQDRRSPAVKSRAVVAADVTGDGRPSLLTATTGATLRRFTLNQSVATRPPPQWISAVPTGPAGSRLRWRAPEADSVTIFVGPPEGALNPLRTTTDTTAVVARSSPHRLALQSWVNGQSSPLSPPRRVRPHPAASVTTVRHPTPTSVEVAFTEQLGRLPPPDRVRLATHGAATSVAPTRNGRAFQARFDEAVAGTQDTLAWPRIADASGLPLADTTLALSFPASPAQSLFVESVTVVREQRVRLTFSAPVVGTLARTPEHYRVVPHGSVVDVEADGDAPSVVTLLLDGVVAGASGQETSLTVSSLRTPSGATLDPEGATVRLTQTAETLANVKVYPNPIDLTQHAPELTVAGLPQRATIRIFDPAGRLVEVLKVENSRVGGTTWDLRTRRGDRVPSGIYLVRVEAPEASPVLKKMAVIR